MTTEEKLEKLKKLADAMYYAAQYLTTDASRLHKTMEDYHQFIINEYHKEEPVSEDLNTAAKEYANNITKKIGYRLQLRRAVCFGANWQKEKMMKEAIEGIARPDDSEIWCNLSSFNLKDGDKVRVVVIKED